jgi:hypothetical protein
MLNKSLRQPCCWTENYPPNIIVSSTCIPLWPNIVLPFTVSYNNSQITCFIYSWILQRYELSAGLAFARDLVDSLVFCFRLSVAVMRKLRVVNSDSTWFICCTVPVFWREELGRYFANGTIVLMKSFGFLSISRHRSLSPRIAFSTTLRWHYS